MLNLHTEAGMRRTGHLATTGFEAESHRYAVVRFLNSHWLTSNVKSYLDIKGSTACFHGNLDIKTLGGAGFASQRTTGDDRSWDLSTYDGIHLDVGKDDGKRYTFVLKDEILPLMDDGREQSTISYEYDFSASGNYSVFIPWTELKPTYRGKEKEDAPPLNTKSIKRWSFMMRSFFGSQEGDFSVEIKSVKAVSQSEDLEAGLTSEKSDHVAAGVRSAYSGGYCSANL